MTKTCTACRSRKMRCDGVTPTCGPCSRARKAIECNFADTSLVQHGPKPALLQKGAACLACRRKKKKCDAVKPACNTCIVAGKEAECMYDDDIKEDKVSALERSNQELQRRVNMLEAQRPLIEFPSSAIIGDWYMQASPSASVSEDGSAFSYHDQAAFSYTSFAPGISLNMPDNFFFERLQAAAVFAETRHLNATICASPGNAYDQRSMFLAHNYSIGFYLRPEKWQAIRNGDYSGAVVHPAIVHMALLIGGEIYTSLNRKSPMLLNEDAEVDRALISLQKPPEPTSLVTAFCLIAWFYFFKRRIVQGQEYLLKAYHIVVLHNLSLGPDPFLGASNLGEPTEDTKELVTALCELAYIDKAATIVLKVRPLFSDSFDPQIKLLPRLQPWLSRYSIVVLRCRSVFLLQEAFRLSTPTFEQNPNSEYILRELDYDALSPDWKDQYWSTLAEVTQHASALSTQMLQSSLRRDPRECVALKVCLMIAQAAQVELHRMPGLRHKESQQRVVSTVLEIISLTKDISEHEDTLLDPILGTCWTIVAAALRQEKLAFMEMMTTSISPGIQWAAAFEIMIACAAKVGARIPYLERTLHDLREVASREALVHLGPVLQ